MNFLRAGHGQVPRKPFKVATWLMALPLLHACTSAERSEPCELDDADGVIGGSYTFELTVDDAEFSPKILKAQNTASVNLTLINAGSTPHDFAIACLPTPNDDGCPMQACFEDDAHLVPVEPGQTGMATFVVPRAEGIYEFRSTLNGDVQRGQFIVQ
jgi:hypothetical protein